MQLVGLMISKNIPMLNRTKVILLNSKQINTAQVYLNDEVEAV